MNNKILTHRSTDDSNWGGRLCRCSKCKTVRRCSPVFDFYAKAPGDLFQCENCFQESLKQQGIGEMLYSTDKPPRIL